MADQTITVRCACGWEAVGSEDQVVPATIEHGQRLHNMTATREDVIAMAVAAPESSTADPSTPEDGP